MALDDFEFAPPYRGAHRLGRTRLGRDQFGDKVRLGFEEMDIGIPQRVVGVEDQMEGTAIAERFVPARLLRMRRGPMRLARRAIPGRRIWTGQLANARV